VYAIDDMHVYSILSAHEFQISKLIGICCYSRYCYVMTWQIFVYLEGVHSGNMIAQCGAREKKVMSPWIMLFVCLVAGVVMVCAIA